MTRLPTLLSAALLSLLLPLAGCGGDHGHDHPHPHPAPAGSGAAPAADEHEHHGPAKPLGEVTLAGFTFQVIQHGDVEPGHEVDVDLEFPAGAKLPETVRAWIGVASGEGSMKVRLDKESATVVHGHPVAPKAIPAGSQLWLEIEAGGQRARHGLAWK